MITTPIFPALLTLPGVIRAASPAQRHAEFCNTQCMYTGSPQATCEDTCHVNKLLGAKAKTAGRGPATPATAAPTLSAAAVYAQRNSAFYAVRGWVPR